MKYMIISSILSVLCFCKATTAQLSASDLLARFNIEGPVFAYDKWTYSLDFEVSDFMTDNMIGYTLYDGFDCKAGSVDITENDWYLLSRFRSDNIPQGDGSGTRTIKVQSEIVPSKLANSGIYRTDSTGVNGVIEYCIRFSNYNMDKDLPNAREVNFLEALLTVNVRLDGVIGVNAQVQETDKKEQAENEEVAIEAYLCDSEENTVPIVTFNQGQTVRVCVTPTPPVLAKGFRMRQIESFTYRRELPFSVRQEAIRPGTNGAPADQLTVVSCRAGSVVCAFETLLFADFFVSSGMISGTGTAFLQLGSDNYDLPARKLQSSNLEIGDDNNVATRSLQSSTANDGPLGFNIDIELVPLSEEIALDETESSAPTMVTSFVTTSVLLAAGLLVLVL